MPLFVAMPSIVPSSWQSRFAFPLLAYTFAAMMAGTTLPTPIYALYSQRMHFTVLSSAVVFLAAHTVGQLLLGRLLSGLSAGVVAGTATAAVIEAAPEAWRRRAVAVATAANIGGLGAGPLLSGLLVQYASYPLRLSFVVHIVLMMLAIVAVLVAPETSGRTGRIGFQRLSVPAEVRPVFVIAATAAFAGFAVTGLFTAVVPAFLSGVIGIGNHAAAGAIVCSLFAASA